MSIVSLPRMAAGVACVLMLATIPAFAEDQDDSASADGHRHGPPGGGERGREARKALADACANMSEGDACKVELDEHSLEGTCNKTEQGDHLFCRPAMHRPMRAAFAACHDKKEGDDCSFERRDGDGKIDGSCEQARFPRAEPRGDGGNDHPDRGEGGERRERPLICMPDRDGD